MSDEQSEHPFGADRPITSSSEDLLGRAPFAVSLAKAIQGWTGEDSLVIGLYGTWGTGKSSLKNMVIEELRKNEEKTPLIVEFNPWQWSAEGNLSEYFVREVGANLGWSDKSKKGKRIAQTWAYWGSCLGVVSTTVEPLSRLIRYVASTCVVIAPITFLFGRSQSWGLWLLIIIVGLLIAASVGSHWLAKLFQALAQARELKTEIEGTTLENLKCELAGLLQNRQTPVLIVMDDVDRLSPDEIKLLFRLIKANADFPNIVYFLLFQRDIIEKSLNEEIPGEGAAYLDKIVQVPFDIPALQRPLLEKLLFEELDKKLSYEQMGQRFDKQRWGNIYIGGLKAYFRTPRDVRRFLSTFSFHASLFRGGLVYEVNPVDLTAIEVLRVFEPTVYARLPLLKETLTRCSSLDQSFTKEREQAVNSLLIEGADESNREALKEILRQIFPAAAWTLGGPRSTGDEQRMYRELRICHPDVFDRYFHFGIPKHDIPQSTIADIIAHAGDRKRLVVQFRLLHQEGLLPIALDRLDAYKEKVDIKYAVPFVTALMDISDMLPEDPSLFVGIGPRTYAYRIVLWYLRQEPDKDRRAAILRQAIAETKGLDLPLRAVTSESQEEKRKGQPDSFLLEEEHVKDLQTLTVQKIRDAAKAGSLLKNRDLAAILYWWRKWAAPGEASCWIQEQAESDDAFVRILVAFTSRTTSHQMGDYVAREHWKGNLKALEPFMSVEAVKTRLEHLNPDDWSPEEGRAINAFRRTLQLREQGRHEDDPFADIED